MKAAADNVKNVKKTERLLIIIKMNNNNVEIY